MNTETGEIVEVKPEDELTKFHNERQGEWVRLNMIFRKGKIIEVEGTYWEVRRADIRAGNPGKLLLKLVSAPAPVKEEAKP